MNSNISVVEIFKEFSLRGGGLLFSPPPPPPVLYLFYLFSPYRYSFVQSFFTFWANLQSVTIIERRKLN